MLIFILLFIVSFLFFFVLFAFIFQRRPKEFRNMVQISKDELLKQGREFAKSLSVTESGNGLNEKYIFKSISKCYSMISKKVVKDFPLTNAEIWFYDNYHLVCKRFLSCRDTMKDLPYCGKTPRILLLARFFVDHSQSEINADRVLDFLHEVSNVLPIGCEEIKRFENALLFAVCEQIYCLAKRLMFQEKCVRYAEKQKINKKMLSYDSYLYYYLQSEKVERQEIENLKKRGIDAKRVFANYSGVLLKNTTDAETLFTALREIDSFIPMQRGITFLAAYKVLDDAYPIRDVELRTLLSYFSIIGQIAKKSGVSEEYVAEKTVFLASKNSLDPSVVLFDYKRELLKTIKRDCEISLKKKSGKMKEILYIAAVVLPAIALSVAVGINLKSIPIGILSVIPFFFLSEKAVQYVLSQAVSFPEPPKMDYSHPTAQSSVDVVICEFCSGVEQLQKSIFHARTIRDTNRDDNITVTLLLDTKASDTAVSIEDREIVSYLKKNKLEENINVFLRKKVLQSNGKFAAKERKRGALMDLLDCYVNKNERNFLYVYNPNYRTPTFIYTLDADNMLLPGAVMEAVNLMLHPYHADYDILSSVSRMNLLTVKTVFSKRFENEFGYETYPFYSGLFYKLFRKEVFCGKGIIRVKSFYEKVRDVFPDKKVLSHDIIEGSLVNVGCGTVTFEDAPSGFLSDRERRKRWQRGDLQLLPFLFGVWKNNKKEIVKKDISPFSRYIMLRNIASVFYAPVLFSLLLVGIIFSPVYLYSAMILFGLPYVADLIFHLRAFIYGESVRKKAKKTIMTLFEMVENFVLLGYYALSDALVFVTTLFKMILGKNLLEWKTYYSTQRAQKLSSYFREFTPFVALYTILLTVLFLTGKSLIFATSYIIVFFFACIELYLSSETKKENGGCSIEQREKLMKYARNTYRYFDFLRTKNGIIPDNYQIKPYKGTAKTTSPTDIGFSLLAEICAEKLNFITEADAVKNINRILDGIKKLPKWYGNLYNWYNAETLLPENRFVSGVDCGNFLACVLITRQYLFSKDKKGTEKAESIVSAADLEKLYDHDKNLFYIGFDGEKFTGHYDLLTSEARILSMVYIAMGGTVRHFYALSREYASGAGNYLLSWGGTLFEVLMPELFFPSPEGSVLYKTAEKNVREQSRNRINGIWGISESGQYLFDENKRYQYAAFGLNKLSLSNKKDEKVVAPYAAFLGLEFLPEKVLRNIEKTEEKGMLFDYGFFESVDMRKGNRKVEEMMSHHQGMILCAITNYLCDDCLKKMMLSYPAVSGTMLLLNEKTSGMRYRKKEKAKQNLPIKEKGYIERVANVTEEGRTAALSDGEYTVIRNAVGSGYSRCGDYYIQSKGEYEECNGTFFYCFSKDKIVSPSYLPLMSEKEKHFFSYSGNEVIYEYIPERIKQSVRLLPRLNGEVHCVDGRFEKLAFYSNLILNMEDSYLSHPSFSDIFINIEQMSGKIILFTRRQGKNSVYMVVRVEGVDDLVWECNKGNFVGRGRTLRNPLFSEQKKYPSKGDVMSPCIGFYGKKKNGKSVQVAFIVGKNKEQLLSDIESLPDNMYQYAVQCKNIHEISKTAQRTLYALLYGNYSNDLLREFNQNGTLYRFAEETAAKKAVVILPLRQGLSWMKNVAELLSEWRLLGIEVRLIIARKYSEKEAKAIEKTMFAGRFYDFMYCDKDDLKSMCGLCLLCYDEDVTIYENNIQNLTFSEEIMSEPTDILERPDIAFPTGNGGFGAGGEYIYTNSRASLLPYSHVVCGERGGFVRTVTGGGFFYFGNSRENKSVAFDNDFILCGNREKLFLKRSSIFYNLLGGASEARYTEIKKGAMRHVVEIGSVLVSVVSTLICDGLCKAIEVELSNPQREYLEIRYSVLACLDWKNDLRYIFSEQDEERLLKITNAKNGRFLYIKTETSDNVDVRLSATKKASVECCFETGCKILFLVSEDKGLLKSINNSNFGYYNSVFISKMKYFGGMEIVSGEKSFDYLFSFLPYQVLSSRLNGKLGFYQVGGATGFRDQLQDAMGFLTEPEILKKQIIVCCKHQYEEGDVMHWWHEPKFGLRTRISDDKLFLVMAVCRYVELTQDDVFLDYEIEYLSSPTLSPSEKNRFENPDSTNYKESVRKHCLKAIRSSLRYGEHRLPIMGSGDWNDGMDDVCAEGKGESVFTAMLAYKVAVDFSLLCDEPVRSELMRIADDLKTAINKFAFDGDRYLRLYSDDGKWLGGQGCDILQLDLLVQSIAVLFDIADGERARTVLDTCKSLIDEQAGVIRLLDPCQTAEKRIGYISDYPSGIRENGGQYTHAAIWYLFALVKIGKQDEAFRLFQMINPVEKCRDAEKNKMYQGEPYVLAGDVYTNKNHYGQCGWSWYTGSAAWAFRLVAEGFFGLERHGNFLSFRPRLPQALDGAVLTLHYRNSVYLIEFRFGLRSRVLQDGVVCEKIELRPDCRSSVLVEVGVE